MPPVNDSGMDLVDVLKAEFEKRQTKNARYSLRAFAQHLGIQSATLSAVLKRKRELPVSKSLAVMNDLKLSAAQKNKILKTLKVPLKTSTIKEYWDRPKLNLEAATTSVISEWEHFAVISLFKIKKFQVTEKSISKRLGISAARAREVWQNLISLKLVKADENGNFKTDGDNLLVSTVIPSQTLRKAHHEELQLAQKKLESIPMQARNFSSLTFAMNAKKMPEANALIMQFIQQMEKTLERGAVDEIYQLGIQLYPLTEPEQKNV